MKFACRQVSTNQRPSQKRTIAQSLHRSKLFTKKTQFGAIMHRHSGKKCIKTDPRDTFRQKAFPIYRVCTISKKMYKAHCDTEERFICPWVSCGHLVSCHKTCLLSHLGVFKIHVIKLITCSVSCLLCCATFTSCVCSRSCLYTRYLLNTK